MRTLIHAVVLGALVLPGLARAQPRPPADPPEERPAGAEKEGLAPATPPDRPPPPPPPPPRAADPDEGHEGPAAAPPPAPPDPYRAGLRHQPLPRLFRRWEPTPVAGWSLGRRRFSVRLELGYPFLDFMLGYGITDVVMIGVGYRGLYSLTHAGYAQCKVRLFQNRHRSVALSVIGRVGYTYVRDPGEESELDYDGAATLVGGDGAFGELALALSLRRNRHALFMHGGVRVAQVKEADPPCDPQFPGECDNLIFEGEAGVLATVFFELGWAMRITRNASYYIALGGDMFTNTKASLLAMVRFRTGLQLDF